MNTASALSKWMVDQIADHLKVDGHEIDIATPFLNLGLSSLDLVQITHQYQNHYGKELPSTLLFEYPTIEDLCAHLAGHQENINVNSSVDLDSPIAVIGLSCDFPGAPNPEAFWDLLEKGKNAITDQVQDRFNKDLSFKAYAGLIDNVDLFDGAHFNISKNELEHMDPQHRLLLKLSWQALENAHINPKSINGSNTGVYVGISSNDYFLRRYEKNQTGSVFDGSGMAHSIAPNRLSYFYNLKGPSIAVDTACSSSLVAVHQACASLKTGDSKMAIAAGVNLLLAPFLTEAFHKANMLSPTGQCRTFSSDADGYVRGEGAGVLILKKLDDALKDNDPIMAVIKSSALNQDGRTSTLTAPSGTSQVAVLKDALKKANLSPKDIDYIEAHGTGTPLGDPIEFSSLSKVYKDSDKKIGLGSVKTNIGHLEAAAGMAGIIKVILGLKNNMMPRSLNFKKVNEKINIAESSFEILQENRTWNPEKDKKRMAGVSSFGFGGTNAHIILQEAPIKKEINIPKSQTHHELFILSASTEKALKKTAQNILLSLTDETILSALCAGLIKSRSTLPAKLALVVDSIADLKEKLGQYLAGKLNKDTNFKEKKTLNKIAFAFTGQGTQNINMGKSLYQKNDFFRMEFNNTLDKFKPYFNKDLLLIWQGADSENENLIYQTGYAQPLIFSLEFALYKLLIKMGIKPDIMIGHSLGELTAAAAAEMMTLEDAVKLVANRARAMQASPEGSMLNINESHETIVNLCQKYHISLAAINGPRSFVLSGDSAVIDKILSENDIKAKKLNVNQGFHSYLMDSVLNDFETSVQDIKYQESMTPIISSFNLKPLKSLNSEYWKNHIRGTTDFYGACQVLDKMNLTHIIEIGPHPVLLTLLPDCFKESKTINIGVLNRKEDSYQSFLNFAKKCYLKSLDPNLSLFAHSDTKMLLPCTAFDERPYWFGKNSLKTTPKIKTKISKAPMMDSNKISTELTTLLANELELPVSEIKPEIPLMNYGTDSLVMLNTLEIINEKYSVSISMSDVFSEVSNLKELTTYIVNNQLAVPTHEIIETEQFNISTPKLNLKREKVKGSGKGVLGNFSANHQNSLENLEPTQKEYLQKLITEFNAKTSKSKIAAEKYRKSLADNRVSAGYRPNIKEMVYPIVFDQAKGSKFTDLDGNNYIDFTMGFGVNLFGHSPNFIQEAIKKQLDKGIAVGPQSDKAGIVASLFTEITGKERVTFVNSGTEALMTAIRLARAASQKEKIVIFEGSYHGHFDGVLGRKSHKGEIVPVAPGVPLSLINDLIVLEYDHPDSIEYIKNNLNDLAAVLVEPVQSRFPETEPKSFLQELRSITKNTDTAFIFDEVITGFRHHTKGAQEYFGVDADIACYGKVLGGGMPIGAVAGSSKYLDFIDGGNWSFGDNSMPVNELTFFAGTFCKHPLAMSACYETLKKFKDEGETLIKGINDKTAYLADTLNSFLIDHEVPLKIVHSASLFRFKYTSNMDWLFFALNNKGIYIWEGRNMFVSTAHTDEDIEQFIQTVKETVLELIDINYIKGIKKKKEATKLDFYHSHKRFSDLAQADDEYKKLSAQIYLALSLKNEVQEDKLIKSFNYLIKRYQSIHASFDLKNEKIIFNENNPKLKVNKLDLSNISDSEKELKNYLKKCAKSPLGQDQLIKIDLIKLKNDHYIVSLIVHHLLMDGLSIAFMTDELAKVYSQLCSGKPIKLNPIYSFKDFLKDQRAKDFTSEKKFWESEQKRWSQGLELKTSSAEGRRIKTTITKDQYMNLRMFGYKNKSSLFITTLSCFYQHLRDTFKKTNWTIGTPVAGHISINETMIGNCVNIVPLTFDISGLNDIQTIIPKLKQYQLDTYRNAEYPLSQIVNESNLQIIFNVEPISKLPKFDDLDAELETYPITASEYPIMINIMKLENVVSIEMDYQLSVFDDEQAKDFLQDYTNALLSLKK